jgi:hypothetical protein
VPDRGLFVLTVPTFKPFTEILVKIAHSLPQSQILEISNQRTVQVCRERKGRVKREVK